MSDDLWPALRALRRSRGYTLLALSTLGGAIGLNTAIFTVADGVLFRRLPYFEPENVLVLQMANRNSAQRYSTVPSQVLDRVLAGSRSVSGAAALEPLASVSIQTAGATDVLPVVAVTANYFELLGTAPKLGRLFDRSDPLRAGCPAVLSYFAWQQRFGGDPRVVGRPVRLGSRTLDVVGVLPPQFVFPTPTGMRPDVVLLLQPADTASGVTYPIVRLAAGVSAQAANSELSTLWESPMGRKASPTVPVLSELRGVMYPSIRPVLRVLLLAAILTLLIAGINVANLLLLRSKKRELDTAIRLALGARFRHLARPVMTEALLIGALSATFALLATHFALNALLSRIPSSLYEDTRLGIGRRVAIFTFTMGLAAGLAISLAGARSLLRTHPRSLLAPQSHWSLRGRFVPGQTIVILQVALALPLVVGVITVGRAFLSITNQPLGFVHTNVIKISMTPDLAEGNDRQRLYLQVLDTLRQRADVLAAGAAGSLPLDGTAPDEGLQSVANPAVRVGAVHVLPGFFEAVGIPLIKGRLLHSADARSSFGAVVINHAAARALFSTRNPLGETFRTRSGRMVTVVGVVGDATSQIGRPPMPLAYLLPADNTRSLSLLVHVPNRQEALLADIRREVSAVATGTPISATWWTDDIRTLRVFSHPRFQMLVFGTFACFSLAVTALGMYVLLGYLGELRTHEFGVRLAIGASPSSVQRLMIRDAVTSSAFGLGIGLFGALWLGGLASATLPGSTIGAWPVISSCVVVLLAACTGALIPAVRAGRLDPAQLLRVS